VMKTINNNRQKRWDIGDFLRKLLVGFLTLSAAGAFQKVTAATPEFRELINQTLNERSILDFQDPTNIKREELDAWFERHGTGREFKASDSFLKGFKEDSSRPNEPKEGTISYKILHYGALDDYLNQDNIRGGNLNKIAEGVIFYPADFVLDIGRSVGALLFEIPAEAMRRVEEKAGLNAESGGQNPHILVIPIKVVAGAAGFVIEYVAILIEGKAEQITQRPLESIAHGLVAYGILH